ncbi:MAG: hypothetical protein GF383_10075 [Candidatus Lokiarchaeota archaeon]|nr:hypothetical protein [Candidatus Lokiarchaeota archaeon]MBD3340882.1 hypothetical protein [Candidatus Lokiarchaeota archaeon]
MSKRERIERGRRKPEVIGSETIGEKIKKRTPWIFGKKLRKPKVVYPKLRGRSLTMPSPSKALGLVAIYIILFVLQTGIVYLLYREPPALGADSAGDPIFLYPSVHDSFIVEGIVASILLFLCSTGFLLIYQASKHSYNRKLAIRILVIGIIMILSTFIALQYIIAEKLGGADLGVLNP